MLGWSTRITALLCCQDSSFYLLKALTAAILNLFLPFSLHSSFFSSSSFLLSSLPNPCQLTPVLLWIPDFSPIHSIALRVLAKVDEASEFLSANAFASVGTAVAIILSLVLAATESMRRKKTEKKGAVTAAAAVTDAASTAAAATTTATTTAATATTTDSSQWTLHRTRILLVTDLID